MIGRVKTAVQSRRGPGISWLMGRVPAGMLVEWSVSQTGWLRIERNKWIPAYAVNVIGELPPPLPPVILDGCIRMVRWHFEMPEEERNYGSFGIVRLYAHPKADKPHSIFPDNNFINSVKAINTTQGFQWLFEHNDTKFFGSHFDGSPYGIPAQGVFHGNLVRVLKEQGNFSQLEGIIGSIPIGMTHLTNPELIHFCWCVDGFGHAIAPPGGMAYMPVVTPTGMKGSNVGGEIQTEIWIESRWLKDIPA